MFVLFFFLSCPDLCDEALGAADYIQLAESFRVIYLAHVPVLTLASRNEMRRFITLVDALYEGHVSLVLLAEAQPTLLLQLSAEEKASCPFDEIFAFDRTVSRYLLLYPTSFPYIYTNTSRSTFILGHALCLFSNSLPSFRP